MNIPVYRIGVVGALFISFLGCAPFARVVPQSYEQRLAAAENLMQEGRLIVARHQLYELWRDNPSRPEAGQMLGECLFRLRAFSKAVSQYEAVLARHPDFHNSRHRKWAAMIASDHRNREQVKKEMTVFLNSRGNTPEGMFALYNGYQYLHMHAEGVEVLKRLASIVRAKELRTAVAVQLQEEIIKSRDVTTRRELAELYLSRFLDARGASLVSRLFLSTFTGPFTVERAEATLSRFPGNHHLRKALAARLIESGDGLDIAESWLQQHLHVWSKEGPIERSQYLDGGAWQLLRTWEEADTYFLLGAVQLQQGRIEEAESLLNKSLINDFRPWRVHRKLHETAMAKNDTKRAIQHLMESMAAGNRSSVDARLLEQLLMEHYGHNGSPQKFYSRQKNIVTFTDATSLGLLGVRSQRVAWGDYNNDGYDDLLLDGPRLFRNYGGKRFEDMTALLGLGAIQGSHGGTWGDFNNDGFLDLFVARRLGNRLFVNEAGNEFRDVTEKVLDVADLRVTQTEASAWGDMDNDGWIDLYLANYEGKSVERGFCDQDQILRNQGNGTFVDASDYAGTVLAEPLCGRGVIWSDLNGDGAQDVIVSNYRLDPNLVWLNNGAGQFRETGRAFDVRGHTIEGAYGHTIGSAVGDLDNDGDLDIYLTNLAHPRFLDYSDRSKLMINTLAATGGFQDQHSLSGIRFEETNADPVLADLDNDGDLDLFITSVYPGRVAHLYQNNGSAQFLDVTWLSGMLVENGWGAAVSDFDKDGDLDLVVGSRDGVKLFQNDGTDNHWLGIELRRVGCNVFGIGSRVTLKYGDIVQVREVSAGRGTGSQDTFTIYFGLGDYHGNVKVTVRDLCGTEIRRTLSEIDRIVRLE